MSPIRTACLLTVIGLVLGSAPLVEGCSGHDGAGGDSRTAFDIGNPANTLNATAVNPIAQKYGVAWWEGSIQDFSSSDAYGNALPRGEDRYAVVFYGHNAKGTAILSGQFVVDATYADKLPNNATIEQVAQTFAGSDVYTYPTDPTTFLPDADRNALLASVIDSFADSGATNQGGGPSSLSLPPRPIDHTGCNSAGVCGSHGSAPAVDMVTAMTDAHNAGIPCDNTLVTAGAVAGGESSLYPGATLTNPASKHCPNGSTDRGLWQINNCYHSDVTDDCAFDPTCAAGAMAEISSNGTNFSPWIAYKNGGYQRWVSSAQEAFNQVCNGTADAGPDGAADAKTDTGADTGAGTGTDAGADAAPVGNDSGADASPPSSSANCGPSQVQSTSTAIQGVLAASNTNTCQTCSPNTPTMVQQTTGQTVEQAASSCSTDAVSGLGQQILDEMNCLTPGALQEFPALPNITMSGVSYPYLQVPALNALISGLQTHMSMNLTVTSMFRTLAEQYMLYEWYQENDCSQVALAATPGSSNHEQGIAFDTPNWSTWQSALTPYGFSYSGTAQYGGSGITTLNDVLAFQKLWNANNPQNLLTEDGIYGSQTNNALMNSPAAGFTNTPTCGASSNPASDAGADGGANNNANCNSCASGLVPPSQGTLHPTCNNPVAPAPKDAGVRDATPDAAVDAAADAPLRDAAADSPITDGSSGDGPDPYYCTEHNLANGYYCGQNIGLTSNDVYDCSNGFIFNFGPCPPGKTCVQGQLNCQ
jgi:hypothetical protein